MIFLRQKLKKLLFCIHHTKNEKSKKNFLLHKQEKFGWLACGPGENFSDRPNNYIMCERLGNFWSLQRIYIAFSNVVFSRAMDKIELKMKQSSRALAALTKRTLSNVAFGCFRWLRRNIGCLAMQFWISACSARAVITRFLSGHREFSRQFSSNRWNISTQKPREAPKTSNEKTPVSSKLWWSWSYKSKTILVGWMFSGEFCCFNAQHRNIPSAIGIDVLPSSFAFLTVFFLPILRCLIFMCFKVCYKLNKNHTRGRREEEESKSSWRREKIEEKKRGKWNYISRIEYIE